MKGVLWIIPYRFGRKFEFSVRPTGNSKVTHFNTKKEFYRFLREKLELGHSDSVKIINQCLQYEGKIVPVDLNECKCIKKEEALSLERKYLSYLKKVRRLEELGKKSTELISSSDDE